jgi:DNA (cytosine-5)-methyltransferase 1
MVDGSRSNYGYVFLDTIEATPYNERPRVLLMENVKALFSQTFAEDWREIQIRLEKLGYTSYSDILNAKDYGIAQNRQRVFIVSILGEYYYEFPKPYKLEKRLKDYLEDEVDEKYYLNDRFIEQMTKDVKNYNRKDKFIGGLTKGDTIARTITTKLDRPESNYIAIPEEIIYTPIKSKGNVIGKLSGGKWNKINESARRVYDVNKEAPTIHTMGGGNTEPKILVKTWNNETKAYKTREDDMPRHRIYTDDSVGFAITTNESQQPSIMIPEATKQGYAEAHDGDGVYINRPHQKRGVVQKGMIQTIKTGQDVGVVVEKTNGFYKQAIEVFNNNDCKHGDVILAFNKTVDKSGCSPTLTTRPEGKKTAILPVTHDLRIRKLTPREALRLMDVEENDIDIILSEVSNTQAYKLAGNSIVVNVLVEIFRKLF